MSEEREIYEPKGGVLIPAGETPFNPEFEIAKMENFLEYRKKVIAAFYKSVDPANHLVCFKKGDKGSVSLSRDGAEYLLSVSGGDYRLAKAENNKVLYEKIDGEDDSGKWYGFMLYGTYIRRDGHVFESSYLVSNRNQFFSTRSVWENSKHVGTERRPDSEIKPEDIFQSASTWCLKTCLRRALGFDVSPESLIEYGVDVSRIPGWSFESKNKDNWQREKERRADPKPQPKQETKSTEPERLGQKQIDEIKLYQSKTGIGMGLIIQACGNIGYEKLEDVPMSKYESLKKEIKSLTADIKEKGKDSDE